MTELDLSWLRSELFYDPGTGEFTRLITRGKHRAGRIAGFLHHSGYIHIGLKGKQYTAHRLAWFYMTGKWPEEVDHINLNKADNRWVNLRNGSHSNNQHNRPMYKINKTGHKGVFKIRNKYTAGIKANNKRHYLGTYDTAEEAAAAYAFASQVYHGEYGRIS